MFFQFCHDYFFYNCHGQTVLGIWPAHNKYRNSSYYKYNWTESLITYMAVTTHISLIFIKFCNYYIILP